MNVCESVCVKVCERESVSICVCELTIWNQGNLVQVEAEVAIIVGLPRLLVVLHRKQRRRVTKAVCVDVCVCVEMCVCVYKGVNELPGSCDDICRDLSQHKSFSSSWWQEILTAERKEEKIEEGERKHVRLHTLQSSKLSIMSPSP